MEVLLRSHVRFPQTVLHLDSVSPPPPASLPPPTDHVVLWPVWMCSIFTHTKQGAGKVHTHQSTQTQSSLWVSLDSIFCSRERQQEFAPRRQVSLTETAVSGERKGDWRQSLKCFFTLQTYCIPPVQSIVMEHRLFILLYLGVYSSMRRSNLT